jgi:hypothetical protein
MILFADPGCPSCVQAVDAIDRVAASRPDVSALVATTAKPELVWAFEAFRTRAAEVGVVESHTKLHDFKTGLSPFLFVLRDGIVRAKGPVDGEARVSQMLEHVDKEVTDELNLETTVV